MTKIKTHKVVKFMVYDRMARKGSSVYSPKSHSAPHFEGHYVEGMEEWANHYCFNKKDCGNWSPFRDDCQATYFEDVSNPLDISEAWQVYKNYRMK